VIPVGTVIATPLPVAFESFTVSIDLVAVLSVFRNVVVGSGSIGLQPLVAVVGPILVAKGRAAEWKGKRYRQSGTENKSGY